MALVIDERAADFWLSEGKVVLMDEKGTFCLVTNPTNDLSSFAF
jgi:hypothetical protein